MNFWEAVAKPIIGLSPMDGVTDASFRYITARHGSPDVVFTEFVNAETAFFAPDTFIRDLTYSELERPIVAQIYGHTPEMFYKIAHVVCELGFDGLDINMGCPAKRVAAKGSGAALILKPELARSIIRAADQGIKDWFGGQSLSQLKIAPEFIQKIKSSNRVRSGSEAPPQRHAIPLSIKTRIGYEKVTVEDWIHTLLTAGPSLISLHGRTLKQGYKGDSDWQAIARAAELARGSGTLMLGNGDLRDMQDIYRRVGETQVDGVLVGRAAQGNPWIFKKKDETKLALRDKGSRIGTPQPVSLRERFKVLLEHSKHFELHWGRQSFVGMRKHLAWYCHALPRAAELRSQMVRVNHLDDVIECLRNYGALVASKPAPIDPPFQEHDSRNEMGFSPVIGHDFISP
jgi:tRNA-dihydrouridine synthase